MRIAQISPLTEAVPPKLYGGTERVISWLTEELVALGHDVTLFASGDSCTSARLEAIWPRALRLDSSICDPYGLHMTMLEQVRRQAEDFDFLHFHLDYFPFSLFSRQPTPFVTTLHGRLDLPELQPVFTTFSSVPVISISNSQRRPVPHAASVKTIHHGLPAHALTPQPVKPTYLAFLGRISPEKCVDRAIRIAERAGLPIKIAAKIDKVDRDYFEEQIKPLMSVIPQGVFNRVADNWRPSLAIADVAGGEWPQRARKALEAIQATVEDNSVRSSCSPTSARSSPTAGSTDCRPSSWSRRW